MEIINSKNPKIKVKLSKGPLLEEFNYSSPEPLRKSTKIEFPKYENRYSFIHYRPHKISLRNTFSSYREFSILPSKLFYCSLNHNSLNNNPSTTFAKLYLSKTIPCHMDNTTKNLVLKWDKSIKVNDIVKLLPICFEGLSETVNPFKFAARKCSIDLLNAIKDPSILNNILQRLFYTIKHILMRADIEGYNATCDITKIVSNYLFINLAS